MAKDFDDITLALAGIFQAAVLVNALATSGSCPESAFDSSINSILKIDAISTAEVYAGIGNLRLGLRQLINTFDKQQEKTNPDIGRYAISLIHLERKFISNNDMVKSVRAGINQAKIQFAYFSRLHPNIISNFAELYKNTLGTFNFRIQIRGRSDLLKNTEIANKCRALLLAGIRSAVLWQQVGGNRWQLLFSRTKYAETAKRILSADTRQPQ